MSFRAIGPQDLWPLLDAARAEAVPETQLVCVGRRLAQAWLAADARRQVDAGRRSWLKPPIGSDEQLVRGLYDQARRDPATRLPAVLSPAQEAALWRLIVDAETAERPLLRVDESARLAGEAWRLAQEWRLALPFGECNGDVEQFNRWSAEFRRRIQRLNAVDGASLSSRVEALIADRRLQIPKRLVLAGFDETTPAQRALFSELSRAGTELCELQIPPRRGATKRFEAADRDRELRAAAEWARAQLERNREARIGIVVSDFGARRADLQRVFDEVLCPVGAARPYNLSLGEPLGEIALVRTALRLLAARHGEIAIDDATALLTSPYWGGSEAELFERAELDRRLRDDGFLQSDLGVWQRIAQRGLNALSQRLTALGSIPRASARLPTAAWAQQFAQWLSACGWPGWRTPDSAEFQALQAWNDTLAEFGALSVVVQSLTQDRAIALLRDTVARRIFQPRTPAVPIQVLSPNETAGLDFDALWIMGLDDEHWPPPARPQPFIPFALQRQASMPRSSGTQQTAFATRMLERLRASADEAVLSHPLQEDELALAPSPLIADVQRIEVAAQPSWPPIWSEMLASARIEHIDDPADPLVHTAAGMRGGTSLFKDQANCAFRGYAVHRLRARPLEEPGFGPNAMDRGNMVHATMERLWRELRDQAHLLSIDHDALDAKITAAVEHGLQEVARRAPQRLGAAMLDLERRRLARLVHGWLELERTRKPFRVHEIEGRVIGEEHSGPRGALVGGISVTVKPDRVDELGDGELLVIDYKTGNPTSKPWFDQRPDEPQLLIYGLQQERLAGVTFAILRAGKTVFRGIGGADDIADGIDEATSWRELPKRWQRELEAIAKEIREGIATVTPKPKACEFCELHALCHIREAP